MILKPTERKNILDFVTKYAGDDIVIAAGLRTMYNIGEAKELRNFIATYKPSVIPDIGQTRVVSTGSGELETEYEGPAAIDNPEDLGPIPKKLGSNGQAIEVLMCGKERDKEWTAEGLSARLNIPIAKVKPMLALLLHRNIIKRVSNHTYQMK